MNDPTAKCMKYNSYTLYNDSCRSKWMAGFLHGSDLHGCTSVQVITSHNSIVDLNFGNLARPPDC